MLAYKLYVLSVAGDVADCFDLVGCQDDADAIAASQARAGHRAMELWFRDRLVRRFPAAPSPAPREPRTASAAPELAASVQSI